MKIKSAAIVVNPTKEWAKRLKREVAALLKRKKIRTSNSPHADLLIVIGGDGTVLFHKEKFHSPIFAVGSESSYLCQARKDNWKTKFQRIITGKFSLEKRLMLACSMGKFRREALNEVVVRSRDHRVIDIHLSVDGKKFSFLADGIIFSTPTGSSTYAYSAGGKELPTSSQNYEIVAVAPYRRRFKPIIVPQSTRSTIFTTSSTADLVFDGQFVHSIAPGTKIKISTSKRKVQFVA